MTLSLCHIIKPEHSGRLHDGFPETSATTEVAYEGSVSLSVQPYGQKAVSIAHGPSETTHRGHLWTHQLVSRAPDASLELRKELPRLVEHKADLIDIP